MSDIPEPNASPPEPREHIAALEAELADAKASEDFFRRIFEEAPLPMIVSRALEGTIVAVNREFSRLNGIPVAEALGRTTVDLGLISPEDRRAIVAEGMRAAGQPRTRELRTRSREGKPLDLLITSRSLPCGTDECVLSAGIDLSERKLVEAYNEGQTRVLEEIARGAPLPRILGLLADLQHATLHDMETAFLLLRGEARNIHVEAAAGLPDACLGALESLPWDPASSPFHEAMARGGPVFVEDLEREGRWRGFLGKTAHFGVHACWSVPIKDRSGAVLGAFLAVSGKAPGLPDGEAALRLQQAAHLAGIALERARTEEELRSSEARHRSLYVNTPAMLHSIDTEGRILSVSRLWLETLGYAEEEVLGRKSIDFLTPASRRKAEQVVPEFFRTGVAKDISYQMVTKSGRILDVLISAHAERDAAGNFVRSLAIITDVTVQKRTEEMLHRARRLESVGRLAGGIAHQFNNLLTAIQGWIALALEAQPPGAAARSHLTESLRACERAAAITRQLLAYGRRQVRVPVHMDLGEALDSLSDPLRKSVPESIRIDWRLRRPAGIILADPGQLEYVVTGLVSNACQAMPEGGTLTLETDRVRLDESVLQGHETPPGEYVMLGIGDTGQGIAPERMAHLFEPFQSGSYDGGPAGLGLAAIYGIVKQSGGHIEVESGPGGTRVKVYFPLRATPITREVSMEAGNPGTPVPARTLLVAEDDPIVRRIAVAVLEREGYRILQAEDGVEALRILEGPEGAGVDLLITDVMMPRMGGEQLAREVSHRHPGVPVLFMSGYFEAAATGPDAGDLRENFLPKPFKPADLAAKVRALARKSATAG